ncbi:MAG: beta-N-acetylhexosaminidase [Oscillospiraceae bacterium]|nr:beta-N-acetylhexosaminidase [Oscillospiraceae bacterium]
MEDFDTFGVMIDMSRNAVMHLDGLKRLFVLLKKMGYNCVLLYTEDTYEVDGEPYFGYMRGRYTKEEMKEIDRFAAEIGMTAIPCIQTLAHLNAIFRWGQFPLDCDDILLTDDPRTYELIDRMFATLSECFRSRRIHIGMDEAHKLGRGKHLDIHGHENTIDIMKRHLERVLQIAQKYDYEVMLWSDMYFRSWNNGAARIPKCIIPQEIVASVPSDVIPVYWDYYQTDESAYADMLENHKQLSAQTWFAGGAWCWYGMIPYNRYTLQSMLPALDACRKHGTRNVFMTMWGDDGGECSHFSQLPSLFYLAEYARGNRDEAKIKAKFKRLVGIDFDEFMQIDCPNDVVPYEGKPRNPSKYMLYSDYFNGFLDYTVQEGAGSKYSDYAKQLYATAKKSRQYGYVFDTAAKLCDVLAIKYELGVRTRKAYAEGNKEALERLARNEYVQVAKRIDIYARAFEQQWFRDNKPHGFDVQDHRIGALLRRTDSCRRRILDYCAGKISRIDELEEELLPFGEQGQSTSINKAPLYATANIIHFSSVPG